MGNTTNATSYPKGLFLRLLSAQADVKPVKKAAAKGVAYKFQGWEDIQPAIKAACQKHGLLLLPSMTSAVRETRERTLAGGGTGITVDWHVEISLEIIDVETGQSKVLTTNGEAADTSDKGLQKAFTSGLKYLLLKTFQVAAIDDTDSDRYTPDRTSAPQAPAPKQRTPEQIYCKEFRDQAFEAYGALGKAGFDSMFGSMTSGQAAIAIKKLVADSDIQTALKLLRDHAVTLQGSSEEKETP